MANGFIPFIQVEDNMETTYIESENWTGTISVRKIDKICELFIDIKLKSELASGANIDLGYLPTGFIPISKFTIPCGSRNRWGTLVINPASYETGAGRIQYFNASTAITTSSGLYAYIIYFVP